MRFRTHDVRENDGLSGDRRLCQSTLANVYLSPRSTARFGHCLQRSRKRVVGTDYPTLGYEKKQGEREIRTCLQHVDICTGKKAFPYRYLLRWMENRSNKTFFFFRATCKHRRLHLSVVWRTGRRRRRRRISRTSRHRTSRRSPVSTNSDFSSSIRLNQTS